MLFAGTSLPGGGGSAWRWICQAAALDDFLDLGAVQGFGFQQTFCDPFEFVAIRQDDPPGLIQQFPHLWSICSAVASL